MTSKPNKNMDSIGRGLLNDKQKYRNGEADGVEMKEMSKKYNYVNFDDQGIRSFTQRTTWSGSPNLVNSKQRSFNPARLLGKRILSANITSNHSRRRVLTNSRLFLSPNQTTWPTIRASSTSRFPTLIHFPYIPAAWLV